MMDLDELKHKFTEEERKKQRQEALDKERWDRTKGLRNPIKSERWGTPERAYKTWEYRARRFVEIANGVVTRLKGEYEKRVSEHEATEFYVHAYDEPSLLQRIGLMPRTSSRVGAVKRKDLIAGNPIRGHPLSDLVQYKVGYITDCHGCYITPEILSGNKEIVNSPLEKAEKIEEEVRNWDVVTDLFKYGDQLRATPSSDYAFRCMYRSLYGDAEDELTELSFGGRGIFIPNPALSGSEEDLLAFISTKFDVIGGETRNMGADICMTVRHPWSNMKARFPKRSEWETWDRRVSFTENLFYMHMPHIMYRGRQV